MWCLSHTHYFFYKAKNGIGCPNNSSAAAFTTEYPFMHVGINFRKNTARWIHEFVLVSQTHIAALCNVSVCWGEQRTRATEGRKDGDAWRVETRPAPYTQNNRPKLLRSVYILSKNGYADLTDCLFQKKTFPFG